MALRRWYFCGVAGRRNYFRVAQDAQHRRPDARMGCCRITGKIQERRGLAGIARKAVPRSRRRGRRTVDSAPQPERLASDVSCREIFFQSGVARDFECAAPYFGNLCRKHDDHDSAARREARETARTEKEIPGSDDRRNRDQRYGSGDRAEESGKGAARFRYPRPGTEVGWPRQAL